MITERQYLDACEIIQEYKEQVNLKVDKLLFENARNLTPNDMRFTWDTYYPSMSIRLWNILITKFEYHTLKNIDIKTFRKTAGCGAKSWDEFNKLINHKS